jgi:general secretion pathway protein D
MKKLRLLLGLLLVVMAALVLPQPLRGDAILSISTPASVTAGSSFTVTVNISGITDLYAFQFDLGFDPAILAATTITEGSFLPSGGTTLFFPGSIDNVGGSISATADTLDGPISGVNGSGGLIEFGFTAIGTGSSALTVSNAIFIDSSLNSLVVDLSDASVNVSPAATSVPEPPSLILAASALFGMMTVTFRRRRYKIF